jgi:uncharacterized membrane protein YphA (DoxX/SURF4 family)
MNFASFYRKTDRAITRWLAGHGILFLRISLGLIFFWFGVLKFVPDLSAAEDLATRTIALLSFGVITPEVGRILLAAWETVIGVGLISGAFLRVILLLLIVQMAGTLTPLVLFPGETFEHFPFAPSLEGQYIIKNLVLISAGMVIGATVRGGKLVPE